MLLAVYSRIWFSIWCIYISRCRSRPAQPITIPSRFNMHLLNMFMADHTPKSSNSLQAFEEAAIVIRGLLDGSVRVFYSFILFSK